MKKVLLLDDNDDILEVVEQVLSYENFDVKTTSKCTNIIRIAELYKPDVIILDYKLTDGNGGDICREFKAHPMFANVPVIIFSAYIHKNVDFSEYKCNAVIAKPFDLSELLQTVNGVLAQCPATTTLS
jgi:DNA-binding response OmpR family regulator